MDHQKLLEIHGCKSVRIVLTPVNLKNFNLALNKAKNQSIKKSASIGKSAECKWTSTIKTLFLFFYCYFYYFFVFDRMNDCYFENHLLKLNISDENNLY